MFIYTILKGLPIFSSILAHQTASMGLFGFIVILTDQGDHHWCHLSTATKTNT